MVNPPTQNRVYRLLLQPVGSISWLFGTCPRFVRIVGLRETPICEWMLFVLKPIIVFDISLHHQSVKPSVQST
jgi:hypothetical protein